MKNNKNTRIILIVNDNSNKFEELYSNIYENNNWIKLDKQYEVIGKISIIDGVFYDNTSLYLKNCFLPNADISKDLGNDLIESIKTVFVNKYSNRVINNIFIGIAKNGINPIQLSILLTKYAPKNMITSGVNIYNFGKTYILNRTFFDSGYSVFGNNIAHEAINSFIPDTGKKRFFYLCKDGKINDYIANRSNLHKLPSNYIDEKNAILINYSKVSADENTKYIILQKVDKIKPFIGAFDDNRDINKYLNIKYNKCNILDIFDNNYFYRKNKKTGQKQDVTDYNPFITFESDFNNVKISNKNVFFNASEDGFGNLGSSSCRQFVIEGTTLFNAIENKLEETEWTVDNAIKLEDYIKSNDFIEDKEDDSLLKILGKEDKETYFSKLITYVFTNSIEITQAFCNRVFRNFPKINRITNVYNEKYNMDVSFTFFDEDENEILAIIENKINASYTPEGIKKIPSFFSNSEQKYVEEVMAHHDIYIKNNADNKEFNQLSKYYLIANVIAKKKEINEIKFMVIGPEYKQEYLESEKNKYFYGEFYTISSYKAMKEAIDEVLNNKKSNFYNLPDDIRDVIIQFRRAIWPYISNSYTYYKRTMSNRFARLTKEMRDRNKKNRKSKKSK